MSLISELKRRNVIRMAGLYLVGAWLIVQVAGTVLPMFGAPVWVPRTIVIVLAIGFLPALAFAWVFELTPDGLKKDAEVDPAQSIAPQTAQRMNRMIIVVLALALGYFALDKFVLAPKRDVTSASTAPQRSSNGMQGVEINEKSIAVLPFENLSADKDNAYFADGMQDEIITRLAKIGQLRVISRGSTERYRGKAENMADIARQLGVANLLEGSVQKVGDRVRINVQLISAKRDEHLWAELYDRDLTDVFAVQSEVAMAIAQTLQARLSGREQEAISDKPTAKLAAYDAYLRGRDLYSRPAQLRADVIGAADAFAEAVRLDPNFGKAWAALSQVDSALVFLRFDASSAREAAARTASEAALRLDPTSAETLMADAYYRYHVVRDYDSARVLFEKLRQEVPSSSEAILALARIARRQSRWKDSLQLYEEAAKLDPRDAQLWMDRAWTFTMVRDFSRARAMIDRALEVQPDASDILADKAYLLQSIGDLDAAQVVLDLVPLAGNDGPGADLRVGQLMLRRRFVDAVRAQEAIPGETDANSPAEADAALQRLGFLRALAGDKAGARRAYLQAKAGLEQKLQQQPRNQFLVTQLAYCEAGLGNKEAALRLGEKAVTMWSASEDPVFGPISEEQLAGIEAQVGSASSAIARIQRLLVTPYGAFPLTQANLRLDPVWDPLRQDPRFKAIVEGPEPKTIFH